ncbi:uncharacterized protein K444DRAFT_646379 [Hyaloscypha bicolor E]|uniref:Transcriptional activator of proteases prtT n=1 Tax=Hyaloscypha bicolor E TaxID=1095630 RepID=A0A2J6ST80_9HELO|nr:uncharacterized protein K444DRAFT_646379 [Hyaloscypha bicolor E]PMD53975.1 hypothetical protein K444DRAFT_646379 [Hyaloscypha bicolor E]
MPPDRGRASKACAACRKIKTRCYESGGHGKACLRCERLTRLERTVSALVERLDTATGTVGRWAPNADTASTSPIQPPPAAVHEAQPGTPSAAPVFLIRDVASEVGVRQPQVAGQSQNPDIIARGLVPVQDAGALIELFQEHYGRWVSFNPGSSSETILVEVRKSPLLLCACCLIAVRHTTQDSASTLAPRLFQEAKTLLSTHLLDVPQSIEFFQAAVILSMWSTTIGQTPLSVDSWLLSGFALQHSLASEVFAPVMRGSGDQAASLSKSELDRCCVWNHLCLVHLHYCVGTRRRAILGRKQIEKCRQILDSDHATNFETRMVAEVMLYWIIYESCSTAQVDLPKTQAALHEWRQEWKFLFDQPRSQFIQMGFHFAQLLVYDQALKSRSAAVRESRITEMTRLSAAIIQLALDTADVRTRHLSDHIYHMITFAAVTLCRLLHMYENQLASTHNIMELDSLVLTLVTWLHSIGLPCHVAHTLGDVVAAFHEKLRPNAHPSPYDQAQDDIGLYFPELLGIETFDGGNFDFIPDWDPYIPGPAT